MKSKVRTGNWETAALGFAMVMVGAALFGLVLWPDAKLLIVMSWLFRLLVFVASMALLLVGIKAVRAAFD